MIANVLISYANPDRGAAERTCEHLENHGIRCWIAPRDIPAGRNWGAAIVEAIENVKVVIVMTSERTFESRHVQREVERADSKGKILIPVFLQDLQPKGMLEYYFGAVQWLRCYPGPLETHFPRLIDELRTSLEGDAGTSRIPPKTPAGITDDDLLALGRAICWDVHEELSGEVLGEDAETLSEPKPGLQVKFIDLACNRRARRAVAAWERKHGSEVLLAGEDLARVAPTREREPVICCLDSLDGTQHWLRGRNLYCTAMSFFARGDAQDSPYRLRVSLVQNADGTIFFAREDRSAAFIDGLDSPMRITAGAVTMLQEAQVCTVCRRPDHYRILVEHLAAGSPFAGLYTFGGNPILAELALGRYDAVFQPDASAIGDSQALWDWLPGGHVAYRSGCCILNLDGSELEIPAAVQTCLNGGADNFPYVAATNRELAAAIVDWLASSAKPG
jgi:fructose-1,6-bisphosphatase/inositol monophosphatase family enzyme